MTYQATRKSMPHQAALQTPPGQWRTQCRSVPGKSGTGASSVTAGKARTICFVVLSLLFSSSSANQNYGELANQRGRPGVTATSLHASRLITLEDSEFSAASEVATRDAAHISLEVTSEEDFNKRPFEPLHYGTPELGRILSGDSDDGNSTHDSHDSHDDHESSKPWGSVIGASLLVNVTSLIGVIILLPAVGRHYLPCFRPKRSGRDAAGDAESEAITEAELEAARAARRAKIMDLSIPAFACGALLATAVFLIFPESLHLIGGQHDDHTEHKLNETSAALESEDGHDHRHRYLEDAHEDHEGHGDDESAVAAKFGCAVVGGFLLPVVLGALFPKPQESLEDLANCEMAPINYINKDTKSTDLEIVSKEEQAASEKDTEHHAEEGVVVQMDYTDDDYTDEPNEVKEEGCWSHLTRNTRDTIDYRLCAVILIGDAFHNFADGVFVGVAFDLCSSDIAISIMAVTLYHEIAQELADFFILTRHAGLSVLVALCLNFASGLFVMFGGIMALAADMSDTATGVVLAIGAGSYVYVAASECLPRVEAAVASRLERLLAILMFISGCVPIGLVLLDHKHCEG